MKNFEGYIKQKFGNTNVLLAGGGHKSLEDFIGSITWDSDDKKIKYTPIGGSSTDLVLFGSNAFDSTAYLPLSGGTLTGNIIFANSQTQAYDSDGLRWGDYSRIGVSATGGVGIYAYTNLYLRPDVSNGYDSGLIISRSSLEYNSNTVWHAGNLTLAPTVSSVTYTPYSGNYVKQAVTNHWLAYWNGAHNSSGASNLQYCDRGRFGTIVTAASGDYWPLFTDSYPTLRPGSSNNWIKFGTSNTSYGILPSTSGGAGSGHNYIGTSSWYWKYAYIDQIYGYLNGNCSGSAGSVSWGNVTSKPGATGGATTPVYWNGSGFTNCTAYGSASVNYATSAGSASSATSATHLVPSDTYHLFRTDSSSWRGGMFWGTSGNEAMSFVVKNSNTRFQFVIGSDITSWSSSTWQSASCAFQILSGGVYASIYNGRYIKFLNTAGTDVCYVGNGSTTYEDLFVEAYGNRNIKFRTNGNERLCILGGGTFMFPAGIRLAHNGGNLYIGASDNAGWLYLLDTASLSGEGYWWIRINGTSAFKSVGSTSDMRTKDVFDSINIDIKNIARAPLFRFKWKDKSDLDFHIGTSALYWKSLYPELITTSKGSDIMALNYSVLGVMSCISLARKVLELEDKIKELELKLL